MCASSINSDGSILLFDVPWAAYEALLEAAGDQRFRHTYQDGALELFKDHLYDVSWAAYSKILKAFGDRHFRHTYQDGTLEIMMSPSEKHEYVKSFLGRVVEIASLEYGYGLRSFGSATQRGKKVSQGLEPDESFYLDRTPRTSRRPRAAISKKDVPDLMIEVAMRRVGLDRMKALAKLKVGEVWRYHKKKVELFQLAERAKYDLVEFSLAFPTIAAADLTKFVLRLDEEDDNDVFRDFSDALRKKRS